VPIVSAQSLHHIPPFFLEDVLPNAFTHAPVEENQRRVHLPGHILSRLDDQGSKSWNRLSDGLCDLIGRSFIK